MKYPSLFLIINILAISTIFSSCDDSSDSEIREVHSKAVITIKDSSEPLEKPVYPPLSADIEFTDNDGNTVVEAEDGSSVQFNIKVKTDDDYKDGNVVECTMYETDNKENSKKIYDCHKDDNIIESWEWQPEKKAFETNLKVMKLPESKSNEFTIECSAIICKELCPDNICVNNSRRKRSRIIKKPFSFVFRTWKTG